MRGQEARVAWLRAKAGASAAEQVDRSAWDWYAESCSCGLPPGECRAHPRARPSQRAPAGDWRVWAYVAGRGAGKTRAGASWVQRRVDDGTMKLGCLIAPTAADIRDVMVEGPSGLIAIAPPWSRPRFDEHTRMGRQEIYAEFLETTDGVWFASFDPKRHVSFEAEFDPVFYVRCAIDAGTSRHTAAVFFQVRPIPGDLKIHPRCTRLKDAFQNYSRQRRGGQWVDFPADGHPEEDMMDALRGGIRDALAGGLVPGPRVHQVHASGIL